MGVGGGDSGQAAPRFLKFGENMAPITWSAFSMLLCCLLASRPAEAASADHRKWSQLRSAATGCDIRGVKAALAPAGMIGTVPPDVNRQSDTGMTALLLAARGQKAKSPQDCAAVVRHLIAVAGAEVTPADRDGNTALHLAAGGDNVAVVDALLGSSGKHGSHIDATNSQGETALHVAAKAGNVKPAGSLLAHCASLSAKDNSGRTPVQSARAHGGWAKLKSSWGNLKDAAPPSCRKRRTDRTAAEVWAVADCDTDGDIEGEMETSKMIEQLLRMKAQEEGTQPRISIGTWFLAGENLSPDDIFIMAGSIGPCLGGGGGGCILPLHSAPHSLWSLLCLLPTVLVPMGLLAVLVFAVLAVFSGVRWAQLRRDEDDLLAEFESLLPQTGPKATAISDLGRFLREVTKLEKRRAHLSCFSANTAVRDCRWPVSKRCASIPCGCAGFDCLLTAPAPHPGR